MSYSGNIRNLAAKGNALVAQELRLVPQAQAAYPQEAVYHVSNPTVGVPQAAAASLLKSTAFILQLHAKVFAASRSPHNDFSTASY